jgi:hypothetical protein
MTTPKSEKANGKLEAMLRREAAMKEAIGREKVRLQKRSEREDARLHLILGEVLASHAAKAPDFRLMLRQVLSSMVLSDSDRAFLQKKGF